ncbi:flagellar export chaperone FliS [Bacillus carboniphilus]|uniref:Flagellar secretion chaperone FliS n=1 Tax=Bacillus carboniphilus TaxID=86663 RepID=A0ABY9JY49_9BACI|nr:flagellar export chaperone FliS [Bacillus carboniphilus]WLR44317.1 flagellar export chaperone FliS [Bacillus carboniphilus]
MFVINPYEAYKENSVSTASPGELTLMLYNGCLKFINIAKISIENNQIENKNINLQKAQKIINELTNTLNDDISISGNLASLYDYMNRRLLEANVHNDVTILEEVQGLIVDLRDTWKQVIVENRQQIYTQGGRV